MEDSLCSSQKNNLRLGLYRCPGCGRKVEIFSDESEVNCYHCGETVSRNKVLPCIDWCVSVHECVAQNGIQKEVYHV